MKTLKSSHIKTNIGGEFHSFHVEDVEYVNPIEFYSKVFIIPQIELLKRLTEKEYKEQGIPEEIAYKVILKKVTKEWKEEFEKYSQTTIPENFVKLLNSSSKKEQIQLLRGQVLTSQILLAFIFKAWTDFGYSYSGYSSQKYHKGVDETMLPKLIHVENGKVETIGDTLLTDGQLKQVVEQRQVIISKIFDKGENWHCLIITFSSIAGKESWEGGQPHFHYISDKWGISRAELIKQIKSGKYPSLSVHIGLLDYSNR